MEKLHVRTLIIVYAYHNIGNGVSSKSSEGRGKGDLRDREDTKELKNQKYVLYLDPSFDQILLLLKEKQEFRVKPDDHVGKPEVKGKTRQGERESEYI